MRALSPAVARQWINVGRMLIAPATALLATTFAALAVVSIARQQPEHATPADHIVPVSARRGLGWWGWPDLGLVALWLALFLNQAGGIIGYNHILWVKIASTVAFLVLLLPTLFATRFPPGGGQRALTRLLPLLAGGLIIWTLSLLARLLSAFGYAISGKELALVGAMFVGLALVAWNIRGGLDDRHRLMVLGFCWLVMSLTWAMVVADFPLHGDRSDMLPNIVSTVRQWLAGNNPYRWYDVGTHRAPITYMPLLWMAYAPFVGVNLDPRWLTLVAQLALLAISWVAVRGHLRAGWWGYLVWIALNPFLVIRHDAHVFLVWPFLAAALLCMQHRRWTAASVLWGLLVVLRTSLWVIFPFYLAFLLWNAGWRNAIRGGLLAAAIILLITAPFLLGSWSGFIDGVIAYPRTVGQQMPTAPWLQVSNWTIAFSAVPLLYKAGLVPYIERTQMVIVAVMFLWMMWRRPALAETLRIMGITFLLFLLLNPLIEVYMYAPLLILIAFALLARQIAQERHAVPDAAESVTPLV